MASVDLFTWLYYKFLLKLLLLNTFHAHYLHECLSAQFITSEQTNDSRKNELGLCSRRENRERESFYREKLRPRSFRKINRRAWKDDVGAEKRLAMPSKTFFMQNNSSRISFPRKRHTFAQLTGIWQKTVDTWQDDLIAEDNWPIVVQ